MALILFLAFSGLVIVIFIKRFGGKASKGWASSLMSDTREEKIPGSLGALTMLMTWMSHLFAFVVGEGVAVQIERRFGRRCSGLSRFQMLSRIFSHDWMAAGLRALLRATGSNLALKS